MNKRDFLLCCAMAAFVFALPPSAVWAQSGNERPFPSPPYIRDPGATAQWTVRALVNSGADETEVSRKLPFVISRTTHRTALSRHDKIVLNTGNACERWLLLGYEVITDSKNQTLNVRYRCSEQSPDWQKVLGLEELAWVNDAAWKSWGQFRNKSCLLIESDIPDPLLDSAGAITSDGASALVRVRVWIDPETRLPIAFHDGRNTMVYEFAAAQNIKLSIPTELHDKLKRYQARGKSLF